MREKLFPFITTHASNFRKVKVNTAQVRSCILVVSMHHTYFTEIYVCRSQGHFVVSLVARQEVTCI